MNNREFNDKITMERLSQYKDSEFTLNTEIKEFLIKFEKHIDVFKESSLEIQGIIEDNLLSMKEFDRIQEILENLAKNAIDTETLIRNNRKISDNLRGFDKNCKSFISQFTFIKDFYKSLSGDYVHDVKKGFLCNLDINNLNKILDNLEKLVEKSKTPKRIAPVTKYVEIHEDYINHLHFIIDDFTPHLGYIELPDSIQYLSSIAEEIEKFSENFTNLSYKKYYKTLINDARSGLDSLVQGFLKVPVNKPIKLKKYLIKKKGTVKLENLIEYLADLY